MFDYLVERENEEMFRTSQRVLDFPDGTKRKVEAYRLVWRWYDRAIDYACGPDADEILRYALSVAECNNFDLGRALGEVLEDFVSIIEQAGGDFTDDNLELLVAKRAIDRFHADKKAS